MKLPFDTAVIIGVGLLGGSLGLALITRTLDIRLRRKGPGKHNAGETCLDFRV